ncbi:MAG: hypothetical protein KC643_06675 [Nitrospira sp.]|nr:hypothetical protein [Nitrospira sp.]
MPIPLAYDRSYALNAICPYYTMFPLEYPLGILRKHLHENPIVVDPFCGRGTTIYAARRTNLRSFGFDTSPIAVAIAQAKLASSSKSDVLKLAKQLLKYPPRSTPTSKFFRHAFAPSTLRQICSLREGLLSINKDSNECVLLRAATLGCLHGPVAKNLELTGYFSNQMPRTFSSKPDYSVRYWQKWGMQAPEVNVLDVLERKLARIPELNQRKIANFGRVKCADARLAQTYRNLHGRLVVITSPPYYGMKTYLPDQWLRNWFLGGMEEVQYHGFTQLRHSSPEDFVRDLSRVWSHLKKRADGIDLYVRLGTISSVKSDAKTLFHESLEESREWRIVYTKRAKTANAGKRQAQQMNGTSEAQEELDFHAVAV